MMGKRAKSLMQNFKNKKNETKRHTPWAPLPDTVKCDRPISPHQPVRNRRGQLVHLVSIDSRSRWAIRARIVDNGEYIHSYTLNGAFNNEQRPHGNDLFNVSRADYAKRFPEDKGFKV